MDDNTLKQRAISLIAEEIDRGRLVVFVGAGCSLAAGLPSWRDLVQDLVGKFSLRTRLTDSLQVAGRLDRDIGKLRVREAVAECLRTSPDVRTDLHKALVRLPVNLFVTTNYDHLIENAFRSEGIEPVVIVSDKDIPFVDPTRKTIVKLHGDLDSPSSLVFSPSDYRTYIRQRPAFVEWLAAIGTQNTILFLGSSFEDPRLIEADDHVLSLFESFRRNPVIVLKRPEKKEGQLEGDFETEKADFEDREREFEERGLWVISVDQYEAIPELLKNVRTRTLEMKKDRGRKEERLAALVSLQADRLESLHTKFSRFKDKDTQDLIRAVRGDGRLPSLSRIRGEAEKLAARLDDPRHELSPEVKTDGYLSLFDAYAATGRKEDLRRARESYEKANAAFDDIRDKGNWPDRLVLARAKLFHLEGNFEEALQTLDSIDSPRGTASRLAYLLAAGQAEQAREIVQRFEKLENDWIGPAVAALIETGNTGEAERLYEETLEELEPSEDRQLLEKLHYHMANAFLRRAYRLEGRQHGMHMIAFPLSQEAEAACKKALYYTEQLFDRIEVVDLNKSLVAALTKVTEMGAAFLTRDFGRADRAARQLMAFRPILREAAEYLLLAAERFEKNELSKVVEALVEDQPESFWAYRVCALLQGLFLNKHEQAWETVKQTVALAVGEEEKNEAARMAVDMSIALGKSDQAIAIVEGLLEESNPFRHFLIAKNLYYTKKINEAEKIFESLQKVPFPPTTAAEIRHIKAEILIEREEWGKARQLLEESVSILSNPSNVKRLLWVCVNQQDMPAILAASERLEFMGIKDEEAEYAKAQAAFSLGKLRLAEKTGRELNSRHPRPMYAQLLARTLAMQGEDEDALKALQPFIQCGDRLDVDCLGLAVKIQESRNHKDAFRLLDSCWTEIQDHPDLLVLHVELGFRTGREDRADESLRRLIFLSKKGKVPANVFGTLTLEQMKGVADSGRKTEQQANEIYSQGRIPRLLLCELNNIPSYLDWAVRTQALLLPDDGTTRIKYTTYATNSFRVEKDQNSLILKRIAAPAEATEIVVDVHSLITLHRLDLLPAMEERFQKIHYPRVVEWIWKEEQGRYGHHQKSKKITYRAIDEILDMNQVRQLSATEQPDITNPEERGLQLARREKAPFVAAYEPPDRLTSFSDVTVIRLQQVVEWLYASGKIREDRYREIIALLKTAPVSTQEEAEYVLRRSPRMILSGQALEFMVEHKLLDAMTELGVQPVVESWTGRFFKHVIQNLEFAEDVGRWQRDLTGIITGSNVFEPFDTEVPNSPKKLYELACVAPIVYSAEERLDLLTDDRMMQMVREGEWGNRQFGTDALLGDLFEKNKLTLDQYARCFVQLCRWRYRFLLPDIHVMLHLSKQYQQKPLGKELEDIVDYARQSMEDLGLFLGLEPTEPPFPIGVKYQLLWLDRWAEFLCHVWVEEGFSGENRLAITRKVLGFGLPPAPKYLKEEVRQRFGMFEDKKLLGKIFEFAMKTERCEKLNGLLEEVFRYYGYDKSKRVAAAKEYMEQCIDILRSDSFETEFIDGQEIQKRQRPASWDEVANKVAKKTIAKVLVAFYGDLTFIPDPEFEALLELVGLKEAEIENYTVADEEEQEILEGTADGIEDRENIIISDYAEPLVSVRRPREERTLIGAPHEILRSPEVAMRWEVLNDLCDTDKITRATKDYLEQHKAEILSGVSPVWIDASEKASKVVLRDFRYARTLFAKAMLETPKRQDWLNEALEALFFPHPDTVRAEGPAVIGADVPLQYLKLHSMSALSYQEEAEEKPSLLSVTDVLNLYHEALGFVPFVQPWDAWSMISKRLGIDQPKGPKAKDVLDSIQTWVEHSDDPMAYLISWEVLIGARQAAVEDQRSYFESPEFLNLLNRVFFVLADPDFRTGNETENDRREFLKQVWVIRKNLAEHYLRHLEIRAQEMSDEQQVLAAWWMAKKASEAVLESMGRRSDRERAQILGNEFQNWISSRTAPFRFQHIFYRPPKPQSPHRFCTLHSPELLASAAIAYIMPYGENGEQTRSGYSGMIMTNAIRSGMLRLLEAVIYVTLAQVPQESGDRVPLLWNTALSVSIPAFLRTYYGEDLELIGKDQLGLINLAETVGRPGFLNDALSELHRGLQEKMAFLSALVLDALHVYLATRGELPEKASVFGDNPTLVREMAQLHKDLGGICIVALTRVLKLLLSWNEIQWAEVFEKQLLAVEFERHAKHADHIVEGVVFAVLLGGRHQLLEKILSLGKTDNHFQKALWQIKEGLEQVYSMIPPAFRETKRKLVRDLEFIPKPE